LLNPTTANLKAVTNIDYDAKGQRIRIEYNEANHPVITEYTYDRETFRLSRLLSMRPTHPEADKRTLQDLSYTYDPVGNITEIRDKAQQTVFFNNSLIEPSNTYVYDALYRLVLAEGREHAVQNIVQRDAKEFETIAGIPFPNSPDALQRYTEAYKYDPVGNILEFHHTGGQVERWIRRYQYALDSNRLLATRMPGEATNLPDYAATPGYGAKYTYDAHGNMTAMPHLTVMEWDFKDQLHATQQQVVNNGTGEKTYYVYDAGGQRVRKVTETQNGNPKDERIYLGGFEVYRKYNGNGQTVVLERETLHIMDDKQRIALVETKTITNPDDKSLAQLIRFQLGNHLGSAALELDDQAQVISYEEYHPYGSTAYHAARSQTETPKRYRYTGKERDEETGFSYHGARYYAAWLGRWVSCDPTGVSDGVNIYAYVSNNPICNLDNNGKDKEPLIHSIHEEQRSGLSHGPAYLRSNPIRNNGKGGLIYQMREDQRKAAAQAAAKSEKPNVEVLSPEAKNAVQQSVEPPAPGVKPVPSISDIPTPYTRLPPPGPVLKEEDPNQKDPSLAPKPKPDKVLNDQQFGSQLLGELKDKVSTQADKALTGFGYKGAGYVGKALIIAPLVIAGATVLGALVLIGRRDDSLLGDAANSPKVYVHKVKSFGPFSDITIKLKLTAPSSQPSTPAASDKPAPNEKERVNSLTIGGSF